MKHFFYAMDPEAKAPAGTQNTEDWFEGYKWMVEGECYVPIPEDSEAASAIEPGDLIWFCFNRDHDGIGTRCWVRGCVEVLRVEPDPLHNRTEIWYDGLTCREVEDTWFRFPPGFNKPYSGFNRITDPVQIDMLEEKLKKLY